jgi:hypothetical protein
MPVVRVGYSAACTSPVVGLRISSMSVAMVQIRVKRVRVQQGRVFTPMAVRLPRGLVPEPKRQGPRGSRNLPTKPWPAALTRCQRTRTTVLTTAYPQKRSQQLWRSLSQAARSVVTLRMRNGTPSRPFAFACHDSLLVPGPPCVRAASPHHRFARRRLRSTPTNGWTACRMHLHMPFGARYRSHLRPYARAYAYPGTRLVLCTSMAGSGGNARPRGFNSDSAPSTKPSVQPRLLQNTLVPSSSPASRPILGSDQGGTPAEIRASLTECRRMARSVAVLRMRNGTPSRPFALRSATACLPQPSCGRSGTPHSGAPRRP